MNNMGTTIGAGGGMGQVTMGQASGQWSAPHGQESSTPNSVVLLTVTNLRVPVTLDHIHAICKGSGGVVARIVTFMKQQAFKALVNKHIYIQSICFCVFFPTSDSFVRIFVGIPLPLGSIHHN
jgi:hypothetical protein